MLISEISEDEIIDWPTMLDMQLMPMEVRQIYKRIIEEYIKNYPDKTGFKGFRHHLKKIKEAYNRTPDNDWIKD